jgi:hypothetical protein
MPLLVLALLLALQVAPAAAQTDGEIRQVLLSSAWCSFSYNKVSGASRSERVQFFPNGSASISSNAESYSSGRSGSAAGQSSRAQTVYWRVQGGDLHLSEDGRSFEPVGLQGKRNSNGSLILVADGKEYAQCR